METFLAEGGELVLLAPGKIEILAAADPALTGGVSLAKSTIVEAYGLFHNSRALLSEAPS